MKVQHYIDRLNEFYNTRYGCDCTEHRCKHWNQCRQTIPHSTKPTDTIKFYYDRVKVGDKYDTNYPRVLFCGLEGAHSNAKHHRIPPISADNPNSKPSLDAINNHYRGVRYVLSYLMAKLSGQNPPSNATKTELDNPAYVEHLRHYCLTNLYKCGFALKKSGLPHSKTMKQECYKIFLNEIDILRPQFVVIQAVSQVPPDFWGAMQKRYGDKEAILINRAARNDHTAAYQLQYDDGSPLYCVWTYHGNGFPFPDKSGGVFPNNTLYLNAELNPVLDAVVKRYFENR